MGIENYEFMKLSEVPEVSEASKDAKVLMVDTITDSEGNVSSPQVVRGPAPAPSGGGGAVTWYSMAILGDYNQLKEELEGYVSCDENTSEDIINNIIIDSSGYSIPVYLFKGSDIQSILEKGENTPYTPEDGDIPTLTEYITSLEEGPVNIKVLNPIWVQSMIDRGEGDSLDNKSGLTLSASSSYMRMKSKSVDERMTNVLFSTLNPVSTGSSLTVPLFTFGMEVGYKDSEEV